MTASASALLCAPTRAQFTAGLGQRLFLERRHILLDPKQQLIAVLMMQAPIQRLFYRHLMRTLVYQAIVE